MSAERPGRRGRAESPAEVWRSAETAVVAGDVETLERLLRDHGRLFRDRRPRSSWLGGLAPDDSAADARSIVARIHEFESWNAFAAHARAVEDPNAPAARFEAAVDAVVSGDLAGLKRLLARDPDLVRARSSRTHHSTLLHYVGANGVEAFRQRTPKRAVEILETLLDAGAGVDATADMYGGGSTTLGLVATSIHPKLAGLQEALIDTLLARGARLDAQGAGHDHPLVNGCLANGRQEAAELLASRGAPLDLEGAAGVGRLDLVRSFFDADGRLRPPATVKQMKDGFSWACEYGRTDVAAFLLDRGVHVGDRLRPHGQTGLHWAAHGGHLDVVALLLARHAPLDLRDESFDGTPLEWALHGWSEADEKAPYYDVVARLVAAGGLVEAAWLEQKPVRSDPRMVAALGGTNGDA